MNLLNLTQKTLNPRLLYLLDQSQIFSKRFQIFKYKKYLKNLLFI